MQEWNSSRAELSVLVDTLGVLDAAELEHVIVSEFNPSRVAVPDMDPIFVKVCLHIIMITALPVAMILHTYCTYVHTIRTYNQANVSTIVSENHNIVCDVPARWPISATWTSRCCWYRTV